MMISGNQIIREIELGNINIDPFNIDNVNPMSVDLTLGSKFSCYKPRFGEPLVLDSKRDTSFNLSTGVILKEGIVVEPGIGYLMHTAETVYTEKFQPIINGKSSIGRLFLLIHYTAGFGDPGFNGQYTLEISSLYNTILYEGMNICQVSFQEIKGDITSYSKTGNYIGKNSKGPIGSQAFKSSFKCR